MRLTKKLIEYIDSFEFNSELELNMIIHDYYKKHDENCYWSELAMYSELAEKYMNLKNLSFNN